MGKEKNVLLVVYNKDIVRHIVISSTAHNFWEVYYGRFNKTEGDRYRTFYNVKNAIRFSERVK